MEQAVKINKLVSLTFDESPDVRKQAARDLSRLDDPAAVFALVELGYDKDPSVRELAQQFLDQKKKTEPELMSFATIFSSGATESEAEEPPADAKEKMMRPITQIFEKRLGKAKAEVAKSKMMPTIEKIYMKSHPPGGKKSTENSGRKVMQEFLTSYLEVMSDLDSIGDGPTPSTPTIPGSAGGDNSTDPSNHEGDVEDLPHDEINEFREGQGQTEPLVSEPQNRVGRRHGTQNSGQKQHPTTPPSVGEALSKVIGHVGKAVLPNGKDGVAALERGDKFSQDLASAELQDLEDLKQREEIEHLPDTFFKKAYETMMLSGGEDRIMKQEMNHMIDEARREIGLAFRFAKKRFKEMKVTNITKIKDGMKNINTDPLNVRAVEAVAYQKSKKEKISLTRVLVNDDGGNEGVIYLPSERGAVLKSGMRIKVVGGSSNTVNSETALTVMKKGNIYIIL